MSISPGVSVEEIREFVHRYETEPYGRRAVWLEAQGVSYGRLRRWRSAVYDGDLDRGLVPRDSGGVSSVPPPKRTAIERQRARERAEQEAEVARLHARGRELDGLVRSFPAPGRPAMVTSLKPMWAVARRAASAKSHRAPR